MAACRWTPEPSRLPEKRLPLWRPKANAGHPMMRNYPRNSHKAPTPTRHTQQSVETYSNRSLRTREDLRVCLDEVRQSRQGELFSLGSAKILAAAATVDATRNSRTQPAEN